MAAARSLKSRALQLLAQREQSNVELRRKLLAHARAEVAAEAARGAPGGGGDSPGGSSGQVTRGIRDGGRFPPDHIGTVPTVARNALAVARTACDAETSGDVIDSAGFEAELPPVWERVPGSPFHADFDSDSDSDANAAPSAEQRVDAVLGWLFANDFISDARFAESRVHARATRFGNLRIRQELKQHGVLLDVDTARALEQTEASRAAAVWQRRFGAAPNGPVEAARQFRFLTARGFSPGVVRRVLRGGAVCGDAEADVASTPEENLDAPRR